MIELDFVIPVYNERENITSVLDAIYRYVKTPCRIFICYDFDEDTTLQAIAEYPKDRLQIVLVKNPGSGPHDAVREGFSRTSAPYVMTHMGDDDYTLPLVDSMVEKAKQGYDIVTGSRFMKGGRMVGARWDKKFLTWFASFTLYHLGRLPVHDATHGVRVFSRRVFDTIEIESRAGFSYSFEFLVKAHRLGWKIWEFPVEWHERKAGTSRFAVLGWLVPYLRWYFFTFATTYLKRPPETVRAKTKET